VTVSTTLTDVTQKWWPGEDGVVPVFAAVIERSGAWLLGKRPQHKRHGGLWEFPGGKLEPGESLTDAAHRELLEELGVAVGSVGAILYRRRDTDSVFEIIFVATTILGEPAALDHEVISWVGPGRVAEVNLAPTDHAFASTWVPTP
jgi:8-oxo-dGTP pyrophosphatase MutT (NUDIX family)